MAWMLTFLTGLSALIVPVAWLLGMLYVWAVVRDAKRRKILLSVMGAITALFPAAYFYSQFAIGRAERQFTQLCGTARPANPGPVVSDVQWLIVDYWEYDPRLDTSHTYARIAWPAYMMRRLLLNGAAPYAGINVRRGSRFDIFRTGDVEPTLSTRRPEPPPAQLSIDWAPASDTGSILIRGLTMVLRDVRTNQVVATQPVYVLNAPGMAAFPSLWAARTLVRQSRFRSCPSALDLSYFVKAVAPPRIPAEAQERSGE